MANTVNETINTNNDKVAFNLDPEEYYDKMANEYNNVVVEKWGYKMPQEVTKCLLTNNISKDLNILDLGCGNGRHSIYLNKKGLERWELSETIRIGKMLFLIMKRQID